MAIAEACFGAVGKGHGIVSASPSAAKFTSLVLGATDLPSSAPAGIEWKPFESGFFDRDHCFLSRTWPDPTAPRGGMVFTHMLMAPWEEIDTPDGLRRLASMLLTASDRAYVCTDRALAASAPSPRPPQLERLLDVTLNGKPPIVWIGETGLCETLAGLWAYLPSTLRRSISFRLAFTPGSTTTTPMFIATPPALAQRWQGHALLDPAVALPATSEVTQNFLDDARSQAIDAFGAKFGVAPASLREWVMLQQAWQTSQTGDGVGPLSMQARLLLALSPTPEPGQQAKDDLLTRLARAVAAASSDQISSLRNFDTKQWASAAKVWSAVQQWAAAHARQTTTDLQVWRHAISDAALAHAWRAAVLGGFDDAFKAADAELCSAWWRHWQEDVSLIEPIFGRLGLKRRLETLLLTNVPATLAIEVADALLPLCARKGAWRLHAVIARRSRALEPALDLHLVADSDSSSSDGVAAFFSDITGGDIIAQALRVNDARLVTLAADAAAQDKTLLGNIDLRTPTWRRILVGAMAQQQDTWQGIADLGAARTALAELVREDADLGLDFLEMLAPTSLADLSAVAEPATLWPKLHASVREDYLTRSAEGWLGAFASGAAKAPTLDPTLREDVTASGQARSFLKGATFATALSYFEAFDEIEEAVAVAWINDLRARGVTVSADDASRLGKLVQTRSWSRAASALATFLHQDRQVSFSPMAMFLAPLLAVADIQRMVIGGFLPADDNNQVWTIFRDVAVSLYPTGPDDAALWSRAGGDPADLSYAHNGRAQWQRTIEGLRKGKYDITSRKLLKEMQEDHPHNTDIAWLLQQQALRR